MTFYYKAEEPVIVDYATFVKDMSSKQLERVDVYDFGDVDITYNALSILL